MSESHSAATAPNVARPLPVRQTAWRAVWPAALLLLLSAAWQVARPWITAEIAAQSVGAWERYELIGEGLRIRNADAFAGSRSLLMRSGIAPLPSGGAWTEAIVESWQGDTETRYHRVAVAFDSGLRLSAMFECEPFATRVEFTDVEPDGHPECLIAAMAATSAVSRSARGPTVLLYTGVVRFAKEGPELIGWARAEYEDQLFPTPAWTWDGLNGRATPIIRAGSRGRGTTSTPTRDEFFEWSPNARVLLPRETLPNGVKGEILTFPDGQPIRLGGRVSWSQIEAAVHEARLNHRIIAFGMAATRPAGLP